MIYSVLLVFQVFVAIGMIVLVLLQQGKGADAGAAFGSGASATVFGSQGSGNFLSRMTGIFAVLFFVNSLTLAYIVVHRPQQDSVTDRVPGAAVEQSGSAESSGTKPDVPAKPAEGSGPADVPDVPADSGGFKPDDIPD